MNKIASNAIFFALFVISCSPKVLPPATEIVHDTTYIVRSETLYDTTIVYLPPVEQESNTTRDSLSRLETTLAISLAQVTSDGKLYHTLSNKAEPIRITIQVPATTVTTSYLSTSFERVPVEVPAEWSKWESFVQIVGYIALALLVLVVVWRRLKKLLNG
jgi:hypothetical protein